MTFHYDEKFKHVFAIPPAVFNSMDEFVKSLTDIPKKARHPKNLDPQFSINIDKKSRRLTFCNRESKNVSFSKSLAANLDVEADKPVMPYSKRPYNTKSWATADLPFDITGTHTVLLYLDIVEPISVGDVKCPLLRSFPFKHREFHNDEIKRSQVLSYRSFEHLRFHKVIKSNFHSIHVELRNAAGRALFPSSLLVKFNLLYYSRKNLDHFLNYHYKKRSAKMNSLSHFMLDFFGKAPFLDPILWSNEQQIFPTNSLNNNNRISIGNRS